MIGLWQVVKMGRPRKYANDAEKMAAYRERNDLVPLRIDIPRELHQEFTEWLKFKDRTQAEVITKLIRQQLLRKR